MTAPGNRTSTTTYDTYGRDSVSSATSQPSTTVVYDVMNRPVSVVDGVNTNPTTISYNETTRERTVQDPKGTAHKEELNALGWLTKRYDASGSGSYVSYRYSPAGLMKSSTNRRGQRVDYTYDNIGRLTSKSGANTSTDNFSYSNDGHITVGWNSVSRDSIFVDPSNAVDSVVTRIGGQRFRVRHSGGTYFNRPDSVTISSTTSVQFPSRIYGHNAGTGALSWIDVGSLGRTNFTFSTDHERTNTSWSTGVSRTEAYTSLRLPYDANFSGGNVGDSFRRAYRYDVLGRIDTEQRPNGTNTRQRAFSYDGLGRLSQVEYRNQPCNVWPTSATVDTAGGWRYTCASPDSTLIYTYDAVGNRTDHSAVTIAGNRYQSFNNASFAYDADGNQIQKYDPSRFNRQFYWSAENRLDSLMQDGWFRIRYEYNAFGQPVKKWRGDVNGISVDRYYLWDGDQWLAELDASMNRVADYVYLPGIDEPFAAVVGQTTATAIRYHAQDELGNVEGHFEGTSVNQNNDYDPWGTPTIGISADSRVLWKGLMWEGDVVSLYHMRNRWYDPESGRFLSEDPAGMEGGGNQYTFANDDPINGFDPIGLCDSQAALAAALAALARGEGFSYHCTNLPPVEISGSTGQIIEGGGIGVATASPHGPVLMPGAGSVGQPAGGRSAFGFGIPAIGAHMSSVLGQASYSGGLKPRDLLPFATAYNALQNARVSCGGRSW